MGSKVKKVMPSSLLSFWPSNRKIASLQTCSKFLILGVYCFFLDFIRPWNDVQNRFIHGLFSGSRWTLLTRIWNWLWRSFYACFSIRYLCVSLHLSSQVIRVCFFNISVLASFTSKRYNFILRAWQVLPVDSLDFHSDKRRKIHSFTIKHKNSNSNGKIYAHSTSRMHTALNFDAIYKCWSTLSSLNCSEMGVSVFIIWKSSPNVWARVFSSVASRCSC